MTTSSHLSCSELQLRKVFRETAHRQPYKLARSLPKPTGTPVSCPTTFPYHLRISGGATDRTLLCGSASSSPSLMAAVKSPPPIHHRLRLLLHRIKPLSFSLPFSFVTLRERYLSLFFLHSGLFPVTIDLDRETSVHIWVPRHRNHRRVPLVLIHGFGGNSKWQWEQQIGPLSKSFDLYIPDLLFFGRSTSLSSDRSVEFQARCMTEAMRRLGVGKYAVCGISYGGFVTYRMAEIAEEEVEKVVILTAGICMTTEQRREIVEAEDRDVSEVLLPQKQEDLVQLIRRSMYRPPRWMLGFVLRDFIEVMYKSNRKDRVDMLKELLVNGAGADPLPVLSQESLIIWGNRDNVFPLHLAHQLKSHLGQKSRLEIVEDVGHACQLENPEFINYLIQKFLLEARSTA